MTPSESPLEILLVEDNLGDVELTRDAFSSSRMPTQLEVARDGHEALEAVSGRGARGAEYRPDIILLDLNLPRKTGREVLAALKRDPALRSIPVIVLSSSRLPHDIMDAYQGHANTYMTKPVGLDKLDSMVRTVEDYWRGHAALPPRGLADAG